MTSTAFQNLKPLYLKIPAKGFTYIFHPLFIPTYIFFWLLFRFPIEFAGITPFALFARKLNVFLMTAFFPAFSIFLMWRLKLIDNIYLRTPKSRVGPYIITMIFYWWMWYLSRYFTDQPIVLKFFYFAIFLTTVFGLTINSFIKISMHAMGVSGAMLGVLLICFYYKTYLGFDIALATLIAGFVCTSRLILKHHTNAEIYSGLFLGTFCQLLAYLIMM
ncbi:MAG: hypothetical protein ABJA79_05655 [Parafilimonas sp.]